MIQKFKIQHFKSIETVEMELGIVNVLIGANGSGKSNLLEAFGVLSAAASGRVDEESLSRRGCRQWGFFAPKFPHSADGQPTLIEAYGDAVSYAVDLSSPGERPAKPWQFRREVLREGTKAIVDRIDSGDPDVGLAALKAAEMRIGSPAAAFLKSLASYGIYTPDTPTLRAQIQDPQTHEPVGLRGGRLADAVDEIKYRSGPKLADRLDEAVSSSGMPIREIRVHRVNKRTNGLAKGSTSAASKENSLTFDDLYFRRGQNQPVLSANAVNDGALFFLFVVVLCLHPEAPKVFALDNAEQALNPLLAKHLVSTMCQWLLADKKPRQILMTTQNPLILDGLPLEDARVRLFTVDRDNRGATHVQRFVLTDKHRQLAKEKDWPLSRMWVNGMIGGVPSV